MRLRAAILVLAATLAVRPAAGQVGVAVSGNTTCPPLSADEVVTTLQQKNRQRAEALERFQGVRIYRLQYRGFPADKDAEMMVNVSYHSPDKKEFTVLSQSGSNFIINHIFKRLLQTEQEAADPENQRSTALTTENYDFDMEGCEDTSSSPQYVLGVAPKSPSKFLYHGRIWVDSRDFAVTQIKAEPAKNPSFWIKKTSIEHKYVKVEHFWLPAENHSESEIRLGGRATLTIEYKDYKILAAAPINKNQGALTEHSFDSDARYVEGLRNTANQD